MTATGETWPHHISIRPVAADEIDAFLDVFEAAWGFGHDDGRRQQAAAAVTAESRFGAFADEGLAGTAMSFAMELTLPGLVRAPMAGVSFVAVHPLRRRRGVLRGLMRAQLDDLHARGVPLAGLGASEAGIYGRFGYGPATWESSWRLPRGAVRRQAGDADGCRLEMVDAQAARELFPAIHEQARQGQVGDVRTYPARWDDLAGDSAPYGTQHLLCRDGDRRPSGYALYRVERKGRYSEHSTVVVDHLIALTGAAYRTLWAHLNDLDLTDEVIASGRPEHEPLRWTLADTRQLAVTGVRDHLWVRLVDLPAALSLRRYATEGTMVLDVTDAFCPWNEGRWLVEGGPEDAVCRPAPSSAAAALKLDAAVLGSLFLGGTSVRHQADAGRVEGNADALDRAQLLFGTESDPWCSTEFLAD